MDNEAACVEFRPSLAMRCWRALGFHYAAYLEPPDEGEYTTHRVVSHWDWRDRLRILISGRTEILLRVHTEAPVKLKGTDCTAVVLVPKG